MRITEKGERLLAANRIDRMIAVVHRDAEIQGLHDALDEKKRQHLRSRLPVGWAIGDRDVEVWPKGTQERYDIGYAAGMAQLNRHGQSLRSVSAVGALILAFVCSACSSSPCAGGPSPSSQAPLLPTLPSGMGNGSPAVPPYAASDGASPTRDATSPRGGIPGAPGQTDAPSHTADSDPWNPAPDECPGGVCRAPVPSKEAAPSRPFAPVEREVVDPVAPVGATHTLPNPPLVLTPTGAPVPSADPVSPAPVTHRLSKARIVEPEVDERWADAPMPKPCDMTTRVEPKPGHIFTRCPKAADPWYCDAFIVVCAFCVIAFIVAGVSIFQSFRKGRS